MIIIETFARPPAKPPSHSGATDYQNRYLMTSLSPSTTANKRVSRCRLHSAGHAAVRSTPFVSSNRTEALLTNCSIPPSFPACAGTFASQQRAGTINHSASAAAPAAQSP